jgi:hypothetical protein
METGMLNGVTHDGNGQLTVTEPGYYLTAYKASVASTIKDVHIEVAISVNGTESTNGVAAFDVKVAGATANYASTSILDLSDNTTVELSVRTTTVGNPTLTVDSINLTALQVGGT